MSEITITEALAELPTIEKRIGHKRDFIVNYLWRPDSMRDPHEKDGGSAELIRRELQSIGDLEERRILIRSAIQGANHANTLTIGEKTRSIADWLTWRREVAPNHLAYLKDLFNRLANLRRKAAQEGVVVKENASVVGLNRDYVIHLNEAELSQAIETLENTLGVLDGKLSLLNATIKIEV